MSSTPLAAQANGVLSRDVTIDPANGVKARLLLPASGVESGKKLPILIYFHGGGFFLHAGFPDPNEVTIHTVITSRTKVLMVYVDYRLFPNALLPAAYDDAVSALKWVLSSSPDAVVDPWISEHGDTEHVFIAGDSAGANITHQLAMRLRDNDIAPVEGAALLCPYFWGKDPIGGETRCSLIRDVVALAWKLVGVPELDHPWMNPLAENAPSIKELFACRRALVCIAGEDELRWRGRAYYDDGLIGSGWGGEAQKEEFEGVNHVWFESDFDSDNTQRLIAVLTDFFHKN